ncbi:MAG: serine/threonine-protein kinase [Candidatus Eisenbacteria bacterium]|uniref:Serine/threonine-protein kinase n=1 Tax=Eiseniibacteriota bacterium TaxID=2212470 RepID=A0A933SF57_UNCEI|nr:serine/threonine-protein kinase [Candidatus Eisenbacteria bacterium]
MLEAGTKLGPYEVVAPLGAGGMGEVYRARDTRLGREVAIKVLPQHLSDNAEVRTRFEREARTISGLNHPNICTLFDVGREGEVDYLVMELVEGDTLAERLRRGPLPTAELVRYGVQIADALDRAHRAGVIHRDLKPGNVMITRSGAKLMDYGLARASGMGGPVSGSGATMGTLTQHPTVASPLTAEGAIVGTFQYMSPEQLEGREADARSDIWALGCVLYEMATGRRAFEGRSQASLIAAILEREPAAIAEAPSGSGTPGAAPTGLDRLVRACLAKDAEERLQTAHDAKLQLQWIGEGAGLSNVSVSAPAPASTARRASATLPWAIAAIVTVVAAGFAAFAVPRLAVPKAVYRFNPDTNPPGFAGAFWPRLSPDGRMLLFQAYDSLGVVRAMLLRLDETKARPIAGTEGLQRAYWSPDSREVVFCAAGKMQRVAVTGGTPAIVCPAPGGADLSWGAGGKILLDGTFTDSLRVVPAGGGELRPATSIDREHGEIGSSWPHFLPDGKHFVFIGNVTQNGRGNIRLGKIGSLDSKLLGQSDGRVEYAPGGWLVFVRGNSLVAQKLDLRGARLTGELITILDDLRTGTSAGHFSISRGGVLALVRGTTMGGTELRLSDRTGKTVGLPLAAGEVANPQLSPDGTRLAYERASTGAEKWGDLHVVDIFRRTSSRLSFTGGRQISSAWSPDGRRIAYVDDDPNAKHSTVMILSADGLGAVDSIPIGAPTIRVNQWSARMPWLVGHTMPMPRSIFLPVDGTDRTVHTLHDSTLLEAQSVLSPDGRFVAGVQGNTQDFHIFVTSVVGPPGRWQISPMAASRPHWTKGGRELVFETTDGKLMAVSIDTSRGFEVGTPQLLFALPRQSLSIDLAAWTVDDSGERFVISTVPPASTEQRAFEVMTDFRSLVTRK